MNLDAIKAGIRARGHKVTPYRMGQVAGRADKVAFSVYQLKAKSTRDYSGRPEPTACPYTNRHSINQWKAGYQVGQNSPA